MRHRQRDRLRHTERMLSSEDRREEIRRYQSNFVVVDTQRQTDRQRVREINRQRGTDSEN